MTTYDSASVRQLVESRAHGLCEYCLIHERDTFLGCQVDHIVSEKHGGPTDAMNLALACTFCNQSKGTDIGSLTAGSGQFTRFYNPRTDRWVDHFKLQGAIIESLTDIGEVTARILGFNEPDRITEREILIDQGRYPPAESMSLRT